FDRQLAISSDGVIRDVPFSALVTSTGRYFGMEYSLVNSAGVDSWALLRTNGRFKPQDRVLAVASPAGPDVRNGALPFIPETYAETIEVAKHFRNGRVLVGRDANIDAIKREMIGVRVFHFAGHSIANETTSALIVAGSQSTTNEYSNGVRLM